jgi:hypothetical protein
MAASASLLRATTRQRRRDTHPLTKEQPSMSIRLTEGQYAAALADIDPRAFTVTAEAVTCPSAEGAEVTTWRDFRRGDTIREAARIFALALVAEGQIEEADLLGVRRLKTF